MLDQGLDTSLDIFYNKDKHAFNYLTVGKVHYLHIVLTYGDEYLFEKYNWRMNELNLMTEDLMQYLQKNVIDLIIIKGPIVGQKCSAIENVWKEQIGCNKLIYLTDPATKEIEREHYSLSSCSILSEPFKFESWAISKPSPGRINDCSGNVNPIPKPVCESQLDCSVIPSTSSATDTACANQYTSQIQKNYHQREPGKP